jgi:hypothetical protein
MSKRETQTSTGRLGGVVTYPAGNPTAPSITNTYVNVASRAVAAYNGHTVIVSADNSVWDTVNGVYLYPGVDYAVNP